MSVPFRHAWRADAGGSASARASFLVRGCRTHDRAPPPDAGISKRFPGVLALDDVDLTVAPGEMHGLLGENGAGKSTLLKILAGAQQPDAGTIAFGGKHGRA